MLPNPDVYPGMTVPQPGGWTGTPPGTRGGGTRATGTDDVVIIMIDFMDVLGQPSRVGQIDTLFNDATPGARSAVNFYNEVSYGMYGVQGQVVPWVHSVRTMAYYGGDGGSGGFDSASGPIYRLTVEAVQLADAAMPAGFFAQFDRDNNGVVDHVIIVHAGDAQEANAQNTDLIWSHRWSVVDADPGTPGDQPLTADGKQIYGYIMVSELSPVGVFVHELGHDLGLPDLYDTDGSSEGVGSWDVMGSGSWNGQPRGSSPAHFSAWSRIKLGWVQPIVVTRALLGEAISAAENASVAYKLPISSSPRGDEYFLVENRDRVGFDARLPGRGLLIWHVDDSLTENSNDAHRLVDLVERDSNDITTQAGDAWANDAIGWGPDTVPNSNSYLNQRTGWKVLNISPAGASMVADISREVVDDLVILALERPCCVRTGAAATVLVTVANRGARTQQGIAVNLSVYLDGLNASSRVCCTGQTVPSLIQGAAANLTWSVPAAVAGKYILEAEAPLARDEIPETNVRYAHFNAATFYGFQTTPVDYDDVEAGIQGWTRNGAGPDPVRWTITQGNGTVSHSPDHAWKFGRVAAGPCLPPLCPEWHTLTSANTQVLGGSVFLYFWHRYDFRGRIELTGRQESDVAFVNVSIGGGPWRSLGRMNGTQPDWQPFHADLSPYISGPTGVVLELSVSSKYTDDSGGWWIDDLAIANAPLSRGLVARAVNPTVTTQAGSTALFRFKLANVGDFNDTVGFDLQPPTGWAAEIGVNETSMETYASYEAQLRPDADATFLLRFTIGDAQPGNRYPVPVTAVSTVDASIYATFDTLTVIADPFGLAGLEKYVFVFLIVFAAIIVIAVVIDAVKKQRGVYRRW